MMKDSTNFTNNMYLIMLFLYILLFCFYNSRDFGYVSRSPVTQRHQCHVFRCDIAAMGIAQAMFDNHAVKRYSQIPKTLGRSIL